MFEVEKQYINQYGRVIEVKCIGNEYAFGTMIVESPTLLIRSPRRVGDDALVSLTESGWFPYTPPPAVHTADLFVKWHPLSAFKIDEEPTYLVDAPGTSICGKVRFTYTERGGGLSVEVLE